LSGYLNQEKERVVGRKPAAAWVLCGGRFCHVAAGFVMLLRVLLCCCGFCYVAAGFVMLLQVLPCCGRICHTAAGVVLRNGGKKIESFLRFS
jgi:hypothetical protein